MKRYDYYRPSAVSLGKKRSVVRRQKGSAFFLRFFFLLITVGLLIGGGMAVSKVYQRLVQAKLSNWKPTQIVVKGVSGDLNKQIFAIAQPWQGKELSVRDTIFLRDSILTKYPMLKSVSVKRKLLKGTLAITVERRVPVAKFVLPDQSLKYIDRDSVIYLEDAPNSLQWVPSIELEGKIPDRLSPELVDLIENTLKLRRELEFKTLKMDLTHNTIKMFTPDNCEIDFGKIEHLKQKATRAAQIMAFSRGKYELPFVLDFRFFEDGKIFLTPKKA